MLTPPDYRPTNPYQFQIYYVRGVFPRDSMATILAFHARIFTVSSVHYLFPSLPFLEHFLRYSMLPRILYH